MDAIEMLKKDHDKVRALFQEFRGGGGLTGLVKRVTGGVSARERRKAVERVCGELEVHTRIEEEVFYPAVRALGDPGLGGQVDEAVREHAQVKEMVAALRGPQDQDADLDARMTSLEEAVEHHATEEENEMFPPLEGLMPDAERAALARRMQAIKRAGRGRAARPARAAAKRADARPAAAKRARKTTAAPASRSRAKARTTGGGRAKARKRARSR